MSKQVFTITGGIGDILLAIGGVRVLKEMFGEDNLKCVLMSHYKNATELLDSFNIEIEFKYYSNAKEFQKVIQDLQLDYKDNLGEARSFDASMYPEISILEKYKNKAEDIVVKQSRFTEKSQINLIGIHPFGSNFANTFLTQQRGVAGKNIPLDYLYKIIDRINSIDPTCMFIVFGSQAEKQYSDALLSKYGKEKIISSFDYPIWTSFALVDYCTYIIASDSCIKSYSAIKKIPTIVFYGNYDDHIRDNKFLLPYIQDKIILPIKFDDKLNNSHLKQMEEYILEMPK